MVNFVLLLKYFPFLVFNNENNIHQLIKDQASLDFLTNINKSKFKLH